MSHIYLTFDDGPNPVWTPHVLDALANQGVRATFFLIDEHITPETAAVVRRIADEGHGIVKLPNRIRAYTAIAGFLDRHLSASG